MDLDLSLMPEKVQVAETISIRQGSLKKSIKDARLSVGGGDVTQEAETDDVMSSVEEDTVAEQEDMSPNCLRSLGNNSKHKSQLTTVERFMSNTDLLANMYGDVSPEGHVLSRL